MSTTETAVTVRDPLFKDLSPEYAEIFVLAKVLQASGYFTDVRDQAQAITKILFGKELGFSPIISMSGIHIIEGKPALSANLLASMIKRSGKYDYRIALWDATECEIVFREKVNGYWEDVGRSRFTIEDAKRAGVAFKTRSGADGIWTRYPKAMLFARALSQGERAYCPDVSSCALYVPEELGATVNENGEVLAVNDLPKSARPVEVTKEAIPLPKREPVVPEPAKEAARQELHADLAAETIADQLFPEEAPVVEAPPPPKMIGVNHKKAFARAWKDALPESLQSMAEQLRADWMKRNGYVDAAGKPTSSAIPLFEFEKVKAAACAFARGLEA